MSSSAYIFPEEILLIIFKFCDICTLSRINRVCKQFYRLTCEILNKRANYLLVTNQKSKYFCERCKPLLSSHNSKYSTHFNWINRLYKKNKICKVKRDWNKGILTKTFFWYYDNYYEHIFAYKRAKNGTLTTNKIVEKYSSNISHITYCNNEIISGHQDGSIRHWKIKSQNKEKYIQQSKVHVNVHVTAITGLAVTSQYIISYSNNNPIKIKKNIHEDGFANENEILYNNREQQNVQAISVDPTETKLAVSINNSILIYDISKTFVMSGIMKTKSWSVNVLWEDPHTILTHFVDYMQKIDTRTFNVVRTWDSSLPNSGIHEKNCMLTCFSSDNLYTIVTGTDRDQVVLWDQRKYASVQVYNINNNKRKCVQFVQFDSTHLYAGTDDGLFELDFTGKKNHSMQPRYN